MAPTTLQRPPSPPPAPADSLDPPLHPVGLTGADFDRLPRVLRRWTPSTLWMRLRKPFRVPAQMAVHRRRAARFVKDPALPRPADGPALVMANLGGRIGLSRGAMYDIEQYILPHHADVTFIDVGRRGTEMLPEGWDPTRRFSYLYMHGMPVAFSGAFEQVRPEQVAGAWRVGIWVWETEHFPESFRHGLDLVHEIWTPSAFAASAFAKGTDLPILVKPHGVVVDEDAPPLDRARFGVPDGAFLGVAIMDLKSCPHRKNPWAHVEAWRKAFGADPRAVLLLKCRAGKRTRVVLRELAEMAGGAGNVRVVDQEFSQAEVTGFQRMADVYVSLHRSEGYGLNIHECLLLGVPVVATHWSANAEFGPGYPHYHPVPARPVPYRGDWLDHYPGAPFHWAEPDTDAAARTLRRLAGGR